MVTGHRFCVGGHRKAVGGRLLRLEAVEREGGDLIFHSGIIEKAKKEGRGGQVPTNLKNASVALTTLSLRSLRATLVPGAGTKTNPRSTGPWQALCGERHTYDLVY